MDRRLGPEEAATVAILHDRGLSKLAIARALAVTEGAVPYRELSAWGGGIARDEQGTAGECGLVHRADSV